MNVIAKNKGYAISYKEGSQFRICPTKRKSKKKAVNRQRRRVDTQGAAVPAAPFRLRRDKETDRVRRDPLPDAGKAKSLLSGGLHIDPADRDL